MSEAKDPVKKNMKICLLGASFDTGNMGVNALAESTIKIILNRWPEAEIVLLGSGLTPQEQNLSVLDRQVVLKTLPIRFSKNIFLPYHFLKFVAYALLVKILPGRRLKKFVTERNPYFKLLSQTDFVADITGGDSFSDIYGFRRFFLGFLCKWLVIFLGKKLVLLPQTYGPFKGLLTRKMARYILNKATVVYSRDRAGVEYLQKALNINTDAKKIRSVPDVAFVLDARAPKQFDSNSLLPTRTEKSIVVGLNISGFLFNGGYIQDNMFGLKTRYADSMKAIIERLLNSEKVIILLIPHVFPPPELMIESDTIACSKIYEALHPKYPGKIFLVENQYSQGEIKYIIGLCDFFIGARMHTCIAAMSQNIPTVGIAYSKKFEGVFESVGLADCVADARSCDEGQLLEKVESAFEQKEHIKKHLENMIPFMKQAVLNIFEG